MHLPLSHCRSCVALAPRRWVAPIDGHGSSIFPVNLAMELSRGRLYRHSCYDNFMRLTFRALSLAPAIAFSVVGYCGSNGLQSVSGSFIENGGQWDSRALYLSQSAGVNVWITESGVVYDLQKRSPVSPRERAGHVVSMEFIGGRHSSARGVGELPGKLNYFVGNRPDQWATGVRRYSEVLSENVLPGVRARWYQHAGMPRYDLIVAPGVDPSRIGLRFRGAQGLRAQGDRLQVLTSVGQIEQTGLFAYQRAGTGIRRVPCSFVAEGSVIRFNVGLYDPLQPLVIDPVLWSTFLGGNLGDESTDVVTDAAGSVLVCGSTTSADFPVTEGAYSIVNPFGQNMAYVAKMSANASTLEFATFVGGESTDIANNIAVDSQGRVVVGGYTNSKFFPTTPGAIDRGLNSPATATGATFDGFLVRLSPDGSSLLMGTYIGGDVLDYLYGLALVGDDIIVAGPTASTDLPATPGAFGAGITTGTRSYIMRIAADGKTIVYRAILQAGRIQSIASDPAGNVYAGGYVGIDGLPTTSGALRTVREGADGFASKLDPTGSFLVYSTYIGGVSADRVESLSIVDGDVYLVGSQFGDFPELGDPQGGFLVRLNSTGSALVYGQALVSTLPEFVATHPSGDAIIVGQSTNPNLPTTVHGFDRTFQGTQDGFIQRYSPNGQQLYYGSYLNGGTNTTLVVTLKNFGEGLYAGSPEKWMLRYGTVDVFERTALMPYSEQGSKVQNNLVALSNIPDNGVSVFGPSINLSVPSASYLVSFVGVPPAEVLLLNGEITANPTTYTGAGRIETIRFDGAREATTNCLSVALTPQGTALVVGDTTAGVLPGTGGTFSPLSGGGADGFVCEVDTAPLFVTSIAGSTSNQVVGGFFKKTRVTLNTNAPAAGAEVALATTSTKIDPAATILVKPGTSQREFNLFTRPVSSDTVATLDASFNGMTVSMNLLLKPGGLTGFTIEPSLATGGTTLTGTVKLSAPAPSGGRTVSISESSAFVSAPTSVVIPSGEREATFQIPTLSVDRLHKADVKAKLGCAARTIGIGLSQ